MPWDSLDCSRAGSAVLQCLPEFAQIRVHWVDDAIQTSHSLSPPPLPAHSLFQPQGLFQWVDSSHKVASILQFQLQHQSFQRIFRFDFLAVQGTLKSLLQHHSSKASILWYSAFFIVQLSHSYMTTGKTVCLTVRMFVGEVMSLLFNMLSRLVIAYLPRSKHLFISWLHSMSTVILEPKKIKSVTVSTFSSFICHEVIRPDAMILVFRMLSFKPGFSLSSFTHIKRLFSSSSLSTIRVVSSAHLRLLIFLPASLIPACELSSLAFPMMYSV